MVMKVIKHGVVKIINKMEIMKRFFNKYLLATAAVVLTLITGCTDVLEPENTNPVDNGPYTLSLTFSKSDDLTKALSLSSDEKTILSTWDATDEIEVWDKARENKKGTLHPVNYSSGATQLTFSGTIDAQVGDYIVFLMNNENEYLQQDGTLQYIAEHCDAHRTADYYTVHAINNNKIELYNGGNEQSVSEILFMSINTIVKFTLTTDGTTPLNATALNVIVGDETIKVNVSAATYSTNGNGVVYVAFPKFNLTGSTKAIGLQATRGVKEYFFYKEVNKLTGYNRIAVTMNDAATYPLTFEAISDNTTVKFTKSNAAAIDFGTDGVQYQTILSGTAGSWTNYTSATVITLPKAGDKVRFRGSLQAYATSAAFNDFQAASTFNVFPTCYVYGNVMSLVSKEGFATKTTLDASYTFISLFDSANIKNHPCKQLCLPATSLRGYCYAHMFENCYYLTSAPILPASNLYNQSVYYDMFKSCSRLKSVTCLATHFYDSTCTKDWLSGVASEGTLTVVAGSTWEDGPNGLPSGWTRVDYRAEP